MRRVTTDDGLSRALSVPWTACVSLPLLTVHSLAHHGRRAGSGTERALDGLCLAPSPHCPFLGPLPSLSWLLLWTLLTSLRRGLEHP